MEITLATLIAPYATANMPLTSMQTPAMHRSLDDYLNTPESATKVLAHAKLLMKLQQVYLQIVPSHLANGSSIANYKSSTIVIHAYNGALAVKLRQMVPTLIEHFLKKGFSCAEIQVKVGARPQGRNLAQAHAKPLSPFATGSIEGLKDSLPENSSLKQALEGLLTRSAKR